ncbi:MAG: DUF1573 domain-containing protein [Acidobacteria bacterium]|nr:DUF1573 domain-containing protein [Acidobacteriota bacterium]
MAVIPHARGLLLGIVLLLAATGGMQSSNSTDGRTLEQARKPEARFRERDHDAGSVEAGGQVSHTFKVRNSGGADLLIDEVRPTCGCTVVEFSKVIKPGREGSVRLTTTTPFVSPSVATSAWVHTNDPAQPVIFLTLKATVRQLLEILPAPSLEIRAGNSRQAEGRLTILNRDRKPLTILGLESSDPNFIATLRTIRSGEEFEVLVRMAGEATKGEFAGQVTLLTNKSKIERLPIAVVAHIGPRVQFTPERLAFGLIEPVGSASARPGHYLLQQAITIRGDRPGFKLLKAETLLPYIELKVAEPAQEGGPFVVGVRLIMERLAVGPISGTVIIHTNDSEFAEVRIPVSGEVR